MKKESCGGHKGGNGTVIEAVTADIIPRKKEKEQEEEERKGEKEREGGVQRRRAGIVLPPLEAASSHRVVGKRTKDNSICTRRPLKVNC